MNIISLIITDCDPGYKCICRFGRLVHKGLKTPGLFVILNLGRVREGDFGDSVSAA